MPVTLPAHETVDIAFPLLCIVARYGVWEVRVYGEEP
jgi:hypothetical protein